MNPDETKLMSKKNKIALIGCGIWGHKILSALIKFNTEVTVIERSDSRKQWALDEGASDFIVYNSHLSKYIHNDTNGIIIATPSSTHRDIIFQTLHLNVPLFIEKPLTTDLTQAQEIAKKAHSKVFMMHIWEYHPGIKMLAEIYQSNELGDLLQIKSNRANWTSPRTDTDTLWNFISHDLSIFNTILGCLPNAKFATAEKHNGVIRDLSVTLGDKIPCTTHISNRYERKIREVRLHFTKGIAILRNEKVDCIELIYGDDRCIDPRIEKRFFKSTPVLDIEIQSFLDYLNGGLPPICNLHDGLDIIKIIDQIDKLAAA